jgi:ABC-type phosphate transport system substrate-binding protein
VDAAPDVSNDRSAWRLQHSRGIRAARCGLAAAAACALVAAPLPARRSAAADAPAPVQIVGEGSYSQYRFATHLEDDMSGATQPVDVQMANTGTFDARQDYLLGGLDFVVSGVPFTTTELGQLKDGAKSLISAPIGVTALGMMLTPQASGFVAIKLVCDPNDPNTPDPSICVQRIPYTGPWRIPAENLAAMLLNFQGLGADSIRMNSYQQKGVLDAFGVQQWDGNFFGTDAFPASVMRSERDETMQYLQQFVQTMAPSTWAKVKADDKTVPWEPITERLGRQHSQSRQGVSQEVQFTGQSGGGNRSPNADVGTIMAVPPSAMDEMTKTYPDTKVGWVQVQNANGEWVEPTQDAIKAAVDAGGEQPLYAMTNKVPGAYPLVWTERLYAPASGLSIQKTEALAAYVRYLATAGQQYSAAVGEGQISTGMRAEALKAADDLVRGNCVGSDREVVTNTDPGSYTPKTVVAANIGTMLHCQAKAAAPTTTTAPPTTAAYIGAGSALGSFGSSDYWSSSAASGGSTPLAASGSPQAMTLPAGTQPGQKTLFAAQSASRTLPYPLLPVQPGSALDAFVTRLLGGALAFLAIGGRRKAKAA